MQLNGGYINHPCGHSTGENNRCPVCAETLVDRVAEVKSWAANRIEKCRDDELKFGQSWLNKGRGKGPPQGLVEAWTERRALEAVLRIIELPQPSSEEK